MKYIHIDVENKLHKHDLYFDVKILPGQGFHCIKKRVDIVFEIVTLEIFQDSGNIFLWHEWEEFTNEAFSQNITSFQYLCLQVMHDYVCFTSPETTVELIIMYDNLFGNSSHFTLKWFWENVLFGGELQINAKNLNFENFESALCMESLSMPLSWVVKWEYIKMHWNKGGISADVDQHNSTQNTVHNSITVHITVYRMP